VRNQSSARLQIDCSRKTYELSVNLSSVRMRQRLHAPPDVVAECERAKAEYAAKQREPIEALLLLPCALVLKSTEESDGPSLAFSVPIRDEPFDPRSGLLSGSREVTSEYLVPGLGNARPTVTWHLRPGAGERLDPRADAGGPYEVERGTTVTLDGGRSRGVDTARWRIVPRCPGDVASPAPVERDGLRTELVTLCELEATLTVEGGGKSSSATAPVKLKRRSRFRTRFSTEDGTLDDRPPLSYAVCPDGKGGPCAIWRGGTNVCACGNEFHTLHPGPAEADNATLDGKGYVTRVVEEPGPFHGWWYVDDYLVDVRRQALVNRWIGKNAGPPLRGYEKSFFVLNQERHNDIANYVQAVGDHERQHSTLIRDWLSAHDPAQDLERLAVPPSAGRTGLAKRADELLRAAEVSVCDASKDPLEPPIWKGDLAAHAADGTTDESLPPKDPVRRPLNRHAEVGGENYGQKATCGAPAPH
jgi:hypothetical protein